MKIIRPGNPNNDPIVLRGCCRKCKAIVESLEDDIEVRLNDDPPVFYVICPTPGCSSKIMMLRREIEPRLFAESASRMPQ